MPGNLNEIRRYYAELLSQGGHGRSLHAGNEAPAWAKPLIQKVAPQITEHFTGLAYLLPEAAEGCRVLDLGCGTGRDTYILSQLVGPQGEAVGVDMTPEPLAIAEKHLTRHMEAFGFQTPNVRFLQGFVEDLRALGLVPGTFDVVISNGTLNLSSAKSAVIAEVFQVLKPGGEFLFADVFADQRVPEEFAQDAELVGELLAGAMYLPDCLDLLNRAGCVAPCMLSFEELPIEAEALREKTRGIRFFAGVIRAFKLPLESAERDFGQSATYLGTLPHITDVYMLSMNQVLRAGNATRVSANTARILTSSRLSPHFFVTTPTALSLGPFTLDHTRQEQTTMMATMQMPMNMMNMPMMGMGMGNMMGNMPMMGSMPMMGMMDMMKGDMKGMMAPMSAHCQMMMNCCQEMMNCCRMMTNMGNPTMAMCQQMMGMCSNMMSCCQQMMSCCNQMMGTPMMMPMCQQMMMCCNQMMMCCNAMMSQCRSMMMGMGEGMSMKEGSASFNI